MSSWMVLAFNFASTHQTENLKGFSEVGENKQLFIANVSSCFYNSVLPLPFSFDNIMIISCIVPSKPETCLIMGRLAPDVLPL